MVNGICGVLHYLMDTGGNDKPKEFKITEFNWVYGDGVNLPKLCNEIEYTYEEDFERNCN